MHTPSDFSTVQAALRHGSALLKQHRSPTPTLDVECLLQHILGWSKEKIYAHSEYALDASQQKKLIALLTRRQRGEPIAYLTNSKEFYGRCFYVAKQVLIPRPETEQLIVAVKKHYDATAPLNFLDIGTGSGCLAVTLALEFLRSQVMAWEVAPAALNVAQHNAAQYDCRNVTYMLHDMFASPPQRSFHCIVCNPPYIPWSEKNNLPTSVVNYEPHAALFAAHGGLACYQRLAHIVPRLLVKDGLLLVEINPAIATQIEKIFTTQGLQVIDKGYDLQKLARIFVVGLTSQTRNPRRRHAALC